MMKDLTFQCIFEEFLREIGGPFVLSTSLYLFINTGHEVLAYLIQERYKVSNYLGRDYLPVQNHPVTSPVFSVSIERERLFRSSTIGPGEAAFGEGLFGSFLEKHFL